MRITRRTFVKGLAAAMVAVATMMPPLAGVRAPEPRKKPAITLDLFEQFVRENRHLVVKTAKGGLIPSGRIVGLLR